MGETARCWLVERSYGDRDLVTLVYATPDGERAVTKELPMTSIAHGSVTVTAATEADDEALEPVDPADRERYREAVERLRSDHGPDDEV
jgi:DNA-binding MarR family transcriptional regulator